WSSSSIARRPSRPGCRTTTDLARARDAAGAAPRARRGRRSELPTGDERGLGLRRLVGEAEQDREIDVHLRQRAELDGRPDQLLLLVRAAVEVGVLPGELRFDPDREALVEHGVADAAGDLAGD